MSTTGGSTDSPFATRLLASSDWSATEFGKVYVFGSLTDGTYVCTPITSPAFAMLGGITIAHSGLIDCSLNRVAPGLLDAVHLTGGCDAHDAAIAAIAASNAV